MRNFEMTCYYVAPILPALLPAQFSAEQWLQRTNAEFKKVSFSRFLKSFDLGA